MPIVAGDILYRLSGGAGNSAPLSSLGGAMSTSTLAGATLYDDVTGAESAAGDTEYRAIYVLNNHGSLTYIAPTLWISTDTPSADTDADIALATEAVNTAIAQTIANENTAPSSITFANTAVSFATGLVSADIPFGQFKGLWTKRVVTAGAAAYADSFTISVQGDTNP
jgi:hypothetical protein